MSNEILVKTDGVSKKFCRSLKRSLWYGVLDVAGELVGHQGDFNKLRQNEFWALDDVSFELRRGECLGLIGPNGAGKSTLLKMLNGLIKPDRGKITMRGRVGALIELGAGFNPILTARENIYVNGSVLGFTKKEIDGKFDHILEFSGLEEFIDTPVQNFSSGMKVRLGFSIASQMEPDVFLIDEVLAVGDASFRTKCIGRIAELAKSSAIIFVSHSMPLIGRMSNKAILLNDGRKFSKSTSVSDAISNYLALNTSSSEYEQGVENAECLTSIVNSVEVDPSEGPVNVEQFSKLEIRLIFKLMKTPSRMMVNLAFFDQEEKNVLESFSNYSNFAITADSGVCTLSISIAELNLNVGIYTAMVGLIELNPDGSRGKIVFTKRGVFKLLVGGKSIGYSPVQAKFDWHQSGFSHVEPETDDGG